MTETEIVRSESAPPTPDQPMLFALQTLMHTALQHGGVEAVRELATLIREERDSAAAREFAADFAEFQATCPPVPKTKSSKPSTGVNREGGKFSFMYAPLDEIADHVRPHLHRHGFSYTWDAKVVDGTVTAVATLRHRNGHSVTAQFSCPVDASSHMNPMQQVASARMYAARYSLIQVLGVTTGDEEAEAVRPEATRPITPDQLANFFALIADTKSEVKKYLNWVKRDRAEDMTEADYHRCKVHLEQRALEQRKGKA